MRGAADTVEEAVYQWCINSTDGPLTCMYGLDYEQLTAGGGGPPIFTITVAATDTNGGTTEANVVITVTNVPIELCVHLSLATVKALDPIHLVGNVAEAGGTTPIQISVDWGDGSGIETITVNPGSGGSIDLSHAYDFPRPLGGDYPVHVEAQFAGIPNSAVSTLLAANVIHQGQLRDSDLIGLPDAKKKILEQSAKVLDDANLAVADQRIRLLVIKNMYTHHVRLPGVEDRDRNFWVERDGPGEGPFVVKGGEPNVIAAVKALWAESTDPGHANRILCKKLLELIFIKAFIDYYEEEGDAGGLAWIARTVGNNVPSSVVGEFMDESAYENDAQLLPGDRVWFKNVLWDSDKHSPATVTIGPEFPTQAAVDFEKARRAKYIGEEGSNTIVLGRNSEGQPLVQELYGGKQVWTIPDKQNAFKQWETFIDAKNAWMTDPANNPEPNASDFVIRWMVSPKTPRSFKNA